MVRLIIWIYLNRGTSQSDNLPEKSNKKLKHDEDSDLIETLKFLWHHQATFDNSKLSLIPNVSPFCTDHSPNGSTGDENGAHFLLRRHHHSTPVPATPRCTVTTSIEVHGGHGPRHAPVVVAVVKVGHITATSGSRCSATSGPHVGDAGGAISSLHCLAKSVNTFK